MKNVPKLRFKGFCDEWREKKLGKITKLTDGVHFTPVYVESGVPFWSVETVVSGAKPKFITKDAHELAIKRCHPEKNDILLTRIGTLAKSMVIRNDEEMSIYVSVALIKANDKFNSEFMNQYFNTEIYYKEFLSKSLLTATPKKINMEDLKDTRVKLPLKKEQEKIANFLTKVDKLIEKQDEKVNNLEQYKKGMLQKIFSQEIRFKKDDGGEYPEWEEKSISEIANLTSSKRIFLSDYVDSGVPFYRGKEITELKANKTPSDILYITEEKYKEIKESYGVPKIGDILLTAVGTLGNSYVINNEEPFYFKDGNLIWFKEISINSIFLDLYLSSPHGQKKVLDSAIGSTQKALTIVALNKIKIYIPNTEEQIKIANFLSKIDSIVEKEKEKLEELRVWKKGLLQQMFV